MSVKVSAPIKKKCSARYSFAFVGFSFAVLALFRRNSLTPPSTQPSISTSMRRNVLARRTHPTSFCAFFRSTQRLFITCEMGFRASGDMVWRLADP